MATYPRTTGTLGESGGGGLFYAADGKVSYNPKTGRKYENKHKIQRDERAGWEDYLIGIGAEYELDPIGNTTFFWVTWRTPESNDTEGIASGVIDIGLTTTWSIEPIELSKDIWEHPLIIEQFRRIVPNQFSTASHSKRILRLMIDAYIRGLSEIPNPSDENTPIIISEATIAAYLKGLGLTSSTDTAVWWLFIDALSYGTTNFNLSSWSLKRRMVLPSNSSVVADMNNVNRMFTESGLLTDLAIHQSLPNTVRFALPDGGYWLKKAPSVSQNQTGSWEINGEWWWAEQYLPFIYGLPIE